MTYIYVVEQGNVESCSIEGIYSNFQSALTHAFALVMLEDAEWRDLYRDNPSWINEPLTKKPIEDSYRNTNSEIKAKWSRSIYHFVRVTKWLVNDDF